MTPALRVAFFSVFFLILLVTLPFRVHAQDRGTGVGIILGEPTGFSLKSWLTSTTAIDAALAWSFSRESSFNLHADYLWHAFHEIKSGHEIPVYFGVGGRLKSGNKSDTRLGVRGVVGIDFLLEMAPVDVFLEIAPIMDVAPATELSFNAGIGVRYFFD